MRVSSVSGVRKKQLMKHKEAELQKVKAPTILKDTEFETPLPLYNYQKVGSAFLYKIGSGLLGDDPGSGKTIMSLAVIEKAKAKKVLIFCPSVVKFQWLNEVNRFLPSTKALVIDGTKAERVLQWKNEARIYIVNYELLLRDFEEMNIRSWDYIIADESNRIANVKAKQTKAIMKLKSKHRIAMTGTPISNKIVELWSMLNFCNPGSMGNYYTFVESYCIKNKWGAIIASKNIEELKKKIARYMIRRTIKEVLPELPDKIHTEIPFELSKKEKEFYDKIKKEILFEIEKEDISKMENPMTISYTLTKMLRLQQITASMELLGDSKTSSKIVALKDLLKNILSDGRKAVVFTKFAKFADIVERELLQYEPLKITGKVKERDQIIKKFNEEDENKVMVMTESGALGLNLQYKASIVVHLDLPYSIGKMDQRIGRVFRIGQKQKVFIYYILARSTIDQHLKNILIGKQKLKNDLLDDPVQFTLKDVRQMLT